jgi:hypothetical protein
VTETRGFAPIAAFGGLTVGVAAVLIGQAIDLQHPSPLWLALSAAAFVVCFAGLIVWKKGSSSHAGHLVQELTPWAIGAVVFLVWAAVTFFA